MNRHYFIRGQYFGHSSVTPIPAHGTYRVPPGRAFFCPRCAEIWALFPVDSQETYVDHVLCDKHELSPSQQWPGCIYLTWAGEFCADLPTELLKREFLLTLAIKEKQDELR